VKAVGRECLLPTVTEETSVRARPHKRRADLVSEVLSPKTRPITRRVTSPVTIAAVAALLFMVIAIVDFTRDTSGVGAVFLVFAAVYAGLAIAGARRK